MRLPHAISPADSGSIRVLGIIVSKQGKRLTGGRE
jgi:hypothetical protein